MSNFELEKIVRKNIWGLKPYSSARSEFKLYGSTSEGQLTLLDANENPYPRNNNSDQLNLASLNRYPDPLQTEVKNILADQKGISTDQIFVGNGSDEAIDLLYRIFCDPEKDSVITCPPTYGMYEVSAAINNIEVVEIPLKDNFALDVDGILNNPAFASAKLLWICSPNNPTGNALLKADLKHDWTADNYTKGGMMDMPFAPHFEAEMLDNQRQMDRLFGNFNGIIVVDEAYQDFTENKSFINRLEDYPNLVVLQTMSKAHGLAGARTGFAFASPDIIALFNKTKPPYNVNELSQQAVVNALNNREQTNAQINEIKANRKMLTSVLESYDFVKKVYPSEANFILAEVTDATDLYNYLREKDIIIRNRDSQIKNCLRFTVGTTVECEALIKTLNNYRTLINE
jgi:histidinol-phosphate aminotransferase